LVSRSVLIDQKILKNILHNLFSNAIKYSPEDKQILFKSDDLDGKLTISVEDHGLGIPKEEQPYMFDRFFRAKNVSNIQGTGLGLNIVKKYVELMDGEISFQSEEGKGTCFLLQFNLDGQKQNEL
jgi:signal transduction histidine kinase